MTTYARPRRDDDVRSPGGVTPATILVVEDEPSQRAALTMALEARGFRVVAVDRGREALDVVDTDQIDVILLDLGLPDEDGISVCRRLRVFTDAPIVVVTADRLESRVVDALDIGADDYVVKPYRMDELMARVRVAFKHSVTGRTTPRTGDLVAGDIRLDVDAFALLVDGEPVDLSPLQFAVLKVLVRNLGQTVTYDSLARTLWAECAPSADRNTLRIATSRIRAALGTGSQRPVIENLRGTGYRLVVPTRS